MKRRHLLSLTALSGLAACSPGSDQRGNTGTLGFSNKLRIPPLATSDVGADGTRRFALSLQAGIKSQFFPDRTTTTWGINGSYLGPTLRASRGEKVAIQVTNRLNEQSTLHWHGMRLPAEADGGPHQPIAPGATWSPHWTIDQAAATCWYHPHPHGRTAQHVYRGLAGLFIVDDEESDRLPRRYGIDDIPLIVQDKVFAADGSLEENWRKGDPSWGATFGLLGSDILVNGVRDPFVEVTTSLVRFRILNASNARTYHFGFSDNRDFRVIASDVGLLAAPVDSKRVQLSPGERAEIVVEFAAGEQTVLRSFAGREHLDSGEFDIIKVIDAARLTTSPALPGRLSSAPAIEVPSSTTTRTFVLSGSSKINGKSMEMSRVDEVIPAGAREIWEIDNIVYAHNFHVHNAEFRILSIDGQTPPAYMDGPKDTVFLPGNAKVRLAIQFGRNVNPTVPHMYHCHILFHEDKGMMGQFVIVEPGTEQQTSRLISVAHQHHSA